MRLRLPPRPAVDYQVRRDNYVWPDHILRVHLTAALIAWLQPDTVLDPACGDGTIVAAAHRVRPIVAARLADISKPNFYYVGSQMRGVLPDQMQVQCQSLEASLAMPFVYDLIVLTEILEHVEDPVAILRMARAKARYVVASSPLFIDDSVIDDNAEHLWQFDAQGYGDMLNEAGWQEIAFIPVHLPDFMYDFQIWAAK